MDDVETQLSSEDHGKDITTVNALLKKHQVSSLTFINVLVRICTGVISCCGLFAALGRRHWQTSRQGGGDIEAREGFWQNHSLHGQGIGRAWAANLQQVCMTSNTSVWHSSKPCLVNSVCCVTDTKSCRILAKSATTIWKMLCCCISSTEMWRTNSPGSRKSDPSPRPQILAPA